MTSDAMNIDADLSDDDLSSAMGTETLLPRDLAEQFGGTILDHHTATAPTSRVA